MESAGDNMPFRLHYGIYIPMNDVLKVRRPKLQIFFDMTIFEILNFNRELLDRLKNSGIRLEDTDYIDLFADFSDMVKSGNKVTYAVAVLANKYSISERKVYSLIKHFRRNCSSGAV